MTTIIERDVNRSSDDSSASTMLVAVIAIVVIVGFALFMFKFLPLNDNAAGTRGTIDVNVMDKTPTPTPANP